MPVRTALEQIDEISDFQVRGHFTPWPQVRSHRQRFYLLTYKRETLCSFWLRCSRRPPYPSSPSLSHLSMPCHRSCCPGTISQPLPHGVVFIYWCTSILDEFGLLDWIEIAIYFVDLCCHSLQRVDSAVCSSDRYSFTTKRVVEKPGSAQHAKA